MIRNRKVIIAIILWTTAVIFGVFDYILFSIFVKIGHIQHLVLDTHGNNLMATFMGVTFLCVSCIVFGGLYFRKGSREYQLDPELNTVSIAMESTKYKLLKIFTAVVCIIISGTILFAILAVINMYVDLLHSGIRGIFICITTFAAVVNAARVALPRMTRKLAMLFNIELPDKVNEVIDDAIAHTATEEELREDRAYRDAKSYEDKKYIILGIVFCIVVIGGLILSFFVSR